jgi:alpha amylase-like protein
MRFPRRAVADVALRRRPLLFQVNSRILIGERGRELGRPATLDEVPDSLLDWIAGRGFAWVWLLGVWTTGPAARAVSRSRADWRAGFKKDLPDLTDADITGSPFAIQAYEVEPEYGGQAALERLRGRLDRRGLRLLLDFVPNHVSPDHPWVEKHPEYFIGGTDEDLKNEPSNWTRPPGGQGRVLACGRDPYFPGWPDTVQLNYLHGGLREAMIGVLRRIAQRCDAVRCDMAMLVLPDVFRHTWGYRAVPRDGTPAVDRPFWPEATERVRADHPGFVFMAEVYWDLEWTLQQQGFGLRFFHEGQTDGRRVHVSMHLGRRPEEAPEAALRAFYDRLFGVLAREEVHGGQWKLCACNAAWPGNPTRDAFVVMAWDSAGAGRLLAVANYGRTQAQCYAQWPFKDLAGRVVLRDLLGDARYERDGAELRAQGLYLDLPPWGCHAFAVESSAR